MRCFAVSGSSMEPSLRSGDLVLVSRGNKEIKKGDLVVYRHPEEDFFVVHRVAAAAGRFYYTCGDANSCSDPTAVNGARVVGRVCLVIPRLGRFLQFFKKEGFS